MGIVLVIQLYGQGARSLAADEGQRSPRYAIDVRNVLNTLEIPIPSRMFPIWKSGMIRGEYPEEKLTCVRPFLIYTYPGLYL